MIKKRKNLMIELYADWGFWTFFYRTKYSQIYVIQKLKSIGIPIETKAQATL